MKTCKKCGIEKSHAEFHKSKISPDGLKPRCKGCRNAEWNEYKAANRRKVLASAARWAKANPDKRTATKLRWAAENPEKAKAADVKYKAANRKQLAATQAIWVKENPEKQKQMMSDWLKENRAHQTAAQRKREADKLQATPGWANAVAIGEYYAFAALKTKLTGVEWQVDHKVPLQSKRVCGLHTDFNLQVITKAENIRKHNKVWPDMPG